jgi:hypothetical protein
MSVVGLDGSGEAVESILDAFMSDAFIVLDERCRADHIGVEDYGKLSRVTLCH